MKTISMLSSAALAGVVLLAAAPASAQAGGATVADMRPNQPGGLVLFTNTPWNDLGDKRPVATVEGVADGRLEVLTVTTVDPGTGVTAVRRVVSNTPIPDSIESRVRFGSPDSAAGRKTVPAPGPVNKAG